nr:uncharacterized protein LOC109155047 [Ipomoea trifida]
MDELQRKLEAREGSPEPQEVLTSPFTDDVMAEPLPMDFRFPTIKAYTGSADPRSHLYRWKKEARSVENFDEKAAIPIFTSNVRSGPFHRDLVQNRPKTYAALLDRVARFAEAEEAERKKKEEERGRRDKAPQDERRLPKPPRQAGPRLAPLRYLTPLTHPLREWETDDG